MFFKNCRVSFSVPNSSISFEIGSVEMMGDFVGWDLAPPNSFPDLIYTVKIIPSKKLSTFSQNTISLKFEIPNEPEAHNIYRPPAGVNDTPEHFGNLVRKSSPPTLNFPSKNS